jgi:hypothetical protein
MNPVYPLVSLLRTRAPVKPRLRNVTEHLCHTEPLDGKLSLGACDDQNSASQLES